jgi:hypothetical protein
MTVMGQAGNFRVGGQTIANRSRVAAADSVVCLREGPRDYTGPAAEGANPDLVRTQPIET